MKDKRLMTLQMAENVAMKLQLGADEKQFFFGLIGAQRARTKLRSDRLKIPVDQFNRLTEWYCFAILALMDTIDFKSKPDWIAERLNISVEQASSALELLAEIGLLTQTGSGFIAPHRRIEPDSNTSTPAIRKLQKQSIARVINIIDDIPVDERELQSITFAGDPNQIKLAKQMIRLLIEKLVSRLESGCRTQVYELNVQLVPISRFINENSESGSKDN